ncbi:MAG: polyprenol monophosphomannose synthase [Nocardioidaceae bacterium]
MTQRCLVVIPTYNEAENIETIIGRLLAAVPQADVLVVDDGSPDGTGDLVDKLAADDTRVHALHRSAKAGLGAAYLAGFDWGLQRGYDLLVEMDADGSHQPEQLPALLDRIDDADLVIGARWVSGGSVVNWPKYREMLSRGANTYARIALGMPVHDSTAGFRVFRRRTLEGIDLAEVRSQGYCFQIDLTRRSLAADFRVTEVPITFVERELGQSKMTADIVREAFVNVARWGARHRADQLRQVWRGRRTRS